MMLCKKVTCPLRYNEVEYTEEFKKLLKQGWTVEMTNYNDLDHTVTFYMSKKT